MKHWKQFSENWQLAWTKKSDRNPAQPYCNWTCFVSQRSNWLSAFRVDLFLSSMGPCNLARRVVAWEERWWNPKPNLPRLLRVIWRRGDKKWKLGMSNRWFCHVGCTWDSSRDKNLSCPVVSRVAIDASFMILRVPSLPIITVTTNHCLETNRHQEGGISERLQNLVDYIITGDFRGVRSAEKTWRGELIKYTWCILECIFKRSCHPIIRQTQRYFQGIDAIQSPSSRMLEDYKYSLQKNAVDRGVIWTNHHTFHQVFSSLANMASWNATEISRNDIVTSRNGFVAMNIDTLSPCQAQKYAWIG